MTSCSPVATARTPPRDPARAGCGSTRRPVTGPSPSPSTSTGERQKRSSIAVRPPGRPARRELAQHRDVPPGGGRGVVGLEPRGAGRIELELGRVDDDVGARQLAELAQLRVRERRLRGPAAAEDDHLGDGGGGERRERVVGRVGRRELVGVQHQHARDVDRHVAVADHHGARAGQVERLVGVRGVAVVPGDELASRRPSPGGRRRGSRAGCRSACRPRRRPRGSAPAAPRASRRRRARRRRRSGSPDAGRSARTCA